VASSRHKDIRRGHVVQNFGVGGTEPRFTWTCRYELGAYPHGILAEPRLQSSKYTMTKQRRLDQAKPDIKNAKIPPNSCTDHQYELTWISISVCKRQPRDRSKRSPASRKLIEPSQLAEILDMGTYSLVSFCARPLISSLPPVHHTP
jgi:hypothetical protein